MREMISVCLVAAMLALGGCGSDDGDGENTGATDTTSADTAADTAADTVADNGGTTDTPSTETSGETSTTADEHPYWPGVNWDSFVPGEGKTAVYHVETVTNEQADVTAHIEREVAWEGGTWTAIVVGDLEPGKDGTAIYIDDSVPWQVLVKGVESYSTGYADGPTVREYMEDPMVIPLAPEAGVTTHVETVLKSTFYGQTEDMAVVYDIVVESYDADVTVAYGTLSGCIKMKVLVGGDLGGPNGFEVEIVAHPEQTIVKWTDAPGFIHLELKEAWK
jgi:hypothetical protein